MLLLLVGACGESISPSASDDFRWTLVEEPSRSKSEMSNMEDENDDGDGDGDEAEAVESEEEAAPPDQSINESAQEDADDADADDDDDDADADDDDDDDDCGNEDSAGVCCSVAAAMPVEPALDVGARVVKKSLTLIVSAPSSSPARKKGATGRENG